MTLYSARHCTPPVARGRSYTLSLCAGRNYVCLRDQSSRQRHTSICVVKSCRQLRWIATCCLVYVPTLRTHGLQQARRSMISQRHAQPQVEHASLHRHRAYARKSCLRQARCMHALRPRHAPASPAAHRPQHRLQPADGRCCHQDGGILCLTLHIVCKTCDALASHCQAKPYGRQALS